MLQKLTEKAIEQYKKDGIVDGVSLDEIIGVASKRRRVELINEGVMPQIERDAEQSFREHLLSTDSELGQKYIDAKEGKLSDEDRKSFWKENAERIGDKQFKLDYISSRITPTETHVILAIMDVIGERYTERISNLKKTAKDQKVNPTQFVSNIELIEKQASDILYPNQLETSILQSMNRTRPATFLYYLCTRQTNNAGQPNITPHFDVYTKVNKEGDLETRSGQTYKKQLETIIGFSQELKGVNHVLVVADFDNYKLSPYPKGVIDTLEYKTRIYMDEIKKQTPEHLGVITQSDFFADKLDNALYQAIFQSVMVNSGEYVQPDQVERELENYMATKQRSLNDWTPERNRFYTASSIARNMCEGKALENGNYVVLVFNNRTTNGIRFNSLVENKIPFIALPKDKEMGSW